MTVHSGLSDWTFFVRRLPNEDFIIDAKCTLTGITLQQDNEMILYSATSVKYPLERGKHTYILNASFKTDDMSKYPNYAELHWILFRPQMSTDKITLPMYYTTNQEEMASSYNEFQNPLYCGVTQKNQNTGTSASYIRVTYKPSTDGKTYTFTTKIYQSDIPRLGLL